MASVGEQLEHRFHPSSSNLVPRPSLWNDVSDATIVKDYILSNRPITSTQNIWAFWHSGWNSMPPWRQRIVIDCVRRQGPSWQVRILDSVPESSWFLRHFITPDLLPECFLLETVQDPHWPQHLSDFVRLPLVFTYGGVWLDTGTMIFRDIEDICWRAICDPADSLELCMGVLTNDLGPNLVLQSFIAALPGNVFLRYWHTIFLELWKGKTSAAGTSTGPLLRMFPQLAVTPTREAALGSELTHEAFNDYLCHIITCGRLILIEDSDLCFSGAEYWRSHCRLLSILEIFPLSSLFLGDAGFTEEREYYLLKLPRVEPVPRDDPEQMEAEAFVEGILRGSCMKKFASGIHALPTVAKLWDADNGADIEPGTWAEYLRWGRVYLTQKRDLKLYTPGEPGLRGLNRVWKVGLTKPVLADTEVMVIEDEA